MTSYLVGHLSDLGIGIALCVLAAGIFVVGLIVGLCRSASKPRPNLPGRLARDDTWPVVDAWEEHVRTTPGMTDWAAWDRQMEETP